jgi:ATP-dependent Clp protease ATP-binding subunit ClpB
MNLNNFTIKAAEAIQQSQQIAYNHQNSNIETEHLLKALLDQQDSPVEFLLKKNAVNVQQLQSRLRHRLPVCQRSVVPNRHKTLAATLTM